MNDLVIARDEAFGGDMHVEITGLAEVSRFLSRFAERIPGLAGIALAKEGEQIIKEAKRLAPVKTGELMASGAVDGPEQVGDEVHVVLSFGGPPGTGNQGETNTIYVDYANIVHEDLQMAHPNGGQAKYLEQPLLAAAPGLGDRVTRRIIAGEAGVIG